jgi:hypothetical protein
MSMGNNWANKIDPDGGTDIIFLGSDGSELDRVVMAGEDIYYQETYSGELQNGLNMASWEQINLNETFASFDASRSPGRFRIDGTLSLMQTFDNGLTRKIDSWPALSGSRRLLPVPNGNDWQLSDFHYRDGRVNAQHSKKDARRVWKNHRMTKDGVGFSIAISPDRHGRSLMRVHPDGNQPGTKGCIGLTCGADRLSAFENTIKPLLSVHGSIRLQVSGSYTGENGGWPIPIKD